MARSFVWTPQKERAVRLEREGRLSQRRIALEIGTTRRTVEGWMRRPAVRQRLAEMGAEDRRRWDAEWQAKCAAMAAEWARTLQPVSLGRATHAKPGIHAGNCGRKPRS